MRFTLFSDPHLGTRRQAHTTSDSAKRLQTMLHVQALVASDPAYNVLCLGDLVDKPFNNEATLLQAHRIAKRCRLVISGNHDEPNRESATTTLQALATLGAPIIAAEDLSTPTFHQFNKFWVVPHHASQQVFEQALAAAAEHAAGKDGHKYLLLHCNYDAPFETADSTLNLSPEMAEQLLGTFTRLFIGHEHNPKSLFGDRLVLVGNIHPTSFSDISDKFRWFLDVETNTLTSQKVWDQAVRYREITYGAPIPDLDGVQFVDVVGAQPAEDGAAVAQFVREVWQAGSHWLLAVRNNVVIIDHLRDIDDLDTHRPALVDLKARIDADLDGSDLQAVYRRLRATAEEA